MNSCESSWSLPFTASGRELVRPQGDRRIALGDQRRLGALGGWVCGGQTYGKTMGKPWENQGKPCITRQKSWGSSSCFLHFPGICLWKLHNIDIYWGYTNGYAVILISFAVKHVLDSAGIIPLFRQCLKQNMNPPATQRPYQLHASTNIQMPICVW